MKSVNEQINPNFVKQARILDSFTPFIRSYLPPEFHDHIKVANIRNNSLVLVTDSPVWTTRLRQLSSHILQTLKDNSSKLPKTQIIHHIQIQTRYQAGGKPPPRRIAKHRPLLSRNTARRLNQSADSIDDPQLKQALTRLARNFKG